MSKNLKFDEALHSRVMRREPAIRKALKNAKVSDEVVAGLFFFAHFGLKDGLEHEKKNL